MEERTVAPAMVNLSALEELDRFDIESKFLGDLVRALFSQSTVDHQKLDFTQLSAALNSLQVSLAGVLLDMFRAHTQPEELQHSTTTQTPPLPLKWPNDLAGNPAMV